MYLKKLILLLLLSVLSYTYSFSQCQISGKIADGSNAAIPYAPIALMNSTDSTIYKGILTDLTF